MRARLRLGDERGFAIVTAIMVLTIMISLGLATTAMVDNQTSQSRRERVKESSFNVSEAVLNGQSIQMSETWPGSNTGTNGPFPSQCVRGDTNTKCPDSTSLANGFSGTDFSSSTTWTVTVRDNVGTAATYYDRAALDAATCPAATGTMSPCTWDSNGDGAMWVRSQATVGGQTRTIVALVKLDLVAEGFPQNTVTAGKFKTTNSGKKVIVDTKGCAAVGAPPGGCKAQKAAPVVVRCTSGTPPPYTRSNTCIGYDQAKGQISPPDAVSTGFAGRAMPINAIDDFRRRAKALGTYYASGCPSSMTGAVVFVESGTCSYTTGTFNSSTAPGAFVINNGTLNLGGNVTYFGVIYAANAQNSTGDVITLGGTATIQGAIAVEGNGGVNAGSSKLNIVYDPDATANLFGYGSSAGVSQNTFRELPAGQ